MKPPFKFFRGLFSFIAIGAVAGFGVLLLGQPSWAMGKPNTTLCASKASRDSSDSDKVTAGYKILTGTKPLFVSVTSTVANSGSFTGGNAELTMIKVPDGRACDFDKVLVNVEAGCSLADSHPVQVKFNCTDGLQDLFSTDVAADNNAITPDKQLLNEYNAASAVLGFNIATDPSCTDGTTDQDQKDCAAIVCQDIKDQLTNGDTLQQSTAGDIGQLFGAMQSTLDRCLLTSSVVQFQGDGASCSPDEIVAKTSFDTITAGPEENVQVNSDGAGGYLMNILTGSTVFTPGDFFQIDMNSCAADFLTQ